MQYSPAVQSALDQAHVAHGRLVTARSALEIEAAWTDFLHKLDRVWNKAEAHFSRSPKCSGWGGPYVQKRKRDPVLRYPMQARNAEEHTIKAIVHKTQGLMTLVSDNPDGCMVIDHLHIENGIVHASDISRGHLHVQPPRPSACCP